MSNSRSSDSGSSGSSSSDSSSNNSRLSTTKVILTLALPKQKDVEETAAVAETITTAAAATTAATESTQIFRYINLINSEVVSPPTSDTIFTYNNISLSSPLTNINSIYRSVIRKNYISFALIELDKSLPEDEFWRERGLKIHISLDDTIEGNIEKAWDTITSILSYYNVARTKVVQVDNIGKDDSQDVNERGKQITIYASLHPDESNWQNVLKAITTALLKKDVKPGYRPDPVNSRAINSNCYFSYRYDLNPKTNEYRPADSKTDKGAFPSGVKDPLTGLDVPTPGIAAKTSPATNLAASAAISPRPGTSF